MNRRGGPTVMCYKPVASQTGAVQQVNEYYPFGDLFPTSGTDNSGNRFRFTGISPYAYCKGNPVRYVDKRGT